MNTVVVPRASPAHRAMLRSQGGPLSGLPFTTLPLSPLQRFDSHLFRVLLLRRLHLPLPLSSRHHRASCSRAGVLGRRGFALESAVARVCREAGARVSVNVFLRDLDLPIGAMDQRRIEVIAEGLPVFHGAQLAITPRWCHLFVPMGSHTVAVPRWMVLPLLSARSAHTQSSQEAEVAPDSSSLWRKRVVASQKRRRRCSDSWQKQRLAPPRSLCEFVPGSLGCSVGAPSCPVLLLGHLLLPCRVFTATWAPMVTRLLSLT